MSNKNPIEEEIKNFIQQRIERDIKDPKTFAENIFKNIKKHWIFGKRSFQPWVESPDINPFVNMILTRSGLLPLYTLHLLNKKEMFGSEIMSEIEKRTNNCWSANPGAIYPLLKELEEEKFVEGYWNLEQDHPRRIYKITSRGKKEYKLLKAVLKSQLKDSINIFSKIFKDIFKNKEKKQDISHEK